MATISFLYIFLASLLKKLTQRAMGLLSEYCGRVTAYFAGGKRAALKRYHVVDKYCL